MPPDSQITIVSGLPRSGTSLMMQMLQRGGMTVVTDDLRAADVDNPRGYFEWAKVKTIGQDSSWLRDVRGKAFKMVSQLLYHLPASHEYRVILMERDLDEMLSSQEKMLGRLSQKAAPRDEMKRSCTLHLARLKAWLARQSHIRVLHVRYNDLVDRPEAEAKRVSSFLERPLDVGRMAAAVDSPLYRNRTSEGTGSRPAIEE